MSTTAWAVVSGSYSDYRIHALFTTKAGAQQHADARNRHDSLLYDEATVEPFPVYTEDEQPKLITIYNAGTKVNANGNIRLSVAEPRITERTEWDYEADTRDRAGIGSRHTGPYAASTNRDRAIKAWQDKRAERLAREAGIA